MGQQKTSCCCTLKVLFAIFLVCAAFFIICFVLAFKVLPDVVYQQVNEAVKLEEDTEQFDRFLKLPFPIIFKVYLFAVNNPQGILNGEKPNVTEIGPFVYKQYRNKTLLSTDEDEDTVSYTETQTYEFDNETSVHGEDFEVTVLNPALMSVYQLAEEFLMAGAADICLKSTFPPDYSDLFITAPVKELLFDGYNFCKNTGNDLCATVNSIICTIASTKRNTDVQEDQSLQFSYLNYKRRAPDGIYTVNRGIDKIESLGHITLWNYEKYTQYWGEQNTCNRIMGCDSTIYPPRLKTDATLSIFSTDICRHVEINYQGEGTYKDIDGYIFGTSPTTLQATTDDVSDDCYCSKLTKDINGQESCFLDGVIDMQTCFGAPVLFSFPHFLWANETYLNGVIGLNPNEDLHKTQLLVEPNTGSPLQGAKRIQLNTVLRPIVGIKSMLNTVRAVLPLLWIEEGFSLTDEYVDKLNDSYFNKIHIVEGVRWALVAVSSVLIVGSCGFFVYKKYAARKSNSGMD